MNNEGQLGFITGLLVVILLVVSGARIETLFQNLLTFGLWVLAAFVAFKVIYGAVKAVADAVGPTVRKIAGPAITVFVFCLPILPFAGIIIGLVYDIEWLWFYSSAVAVFVSYGPLKSVIDESKWFKKEAAK
jgi:hypothetical protein